MPHDIEVMGSNPVGCWDFFLFLSLSFQKCVLNQVPNGGATLLIFLSIEMLEESLYLGVSSTSSLIAGCNEDEATGPPTPAPEPSSSTSLKKKTTSWFKRWCLMFYASVLFSCNRNMSFLFLSQVEFKRQAFGSGTLHCIGIIKWTYLAL